MRQPSFIENLSKVSKNRFGMRLSPIFYVMLDRSVQNIQLSCLFFHVISSLSNCQSDDPYYFTPYFLNHLTCIFCCIDVVNNTIYNSVCRFFFWTFLDQCVEEILFLQNLIHLKIERHNPNTNDSPFHLAFIFIH